MSKRKNSTRSVELNGSSIQLRFRKIVGQSIHDDDNNISQVNRRLCSRSPAVSSAGIIPHKLGVERDSERRNTEKRWRCRLSMDQRGICSPCSERQKIARSWVIRDGAFELVQNCHDSTAEGRTAALQIRREMVMGRIDLLPRLSAGCLSEETTSPVLSSPILRRIAMKAVLRRRVSEPPDWHLPYRQS